MTVSKRKDIERMKELERCFLSAILSDLGSGNIRGYLERYPGITWRHFRDRRHQVLWRALQSLKVDLSFEEQMDILEAEDGGRTEAAKLADQARPAAWLERELRRAGALSLAGGRAYLREVSEAWAVPLNIDFFAKQLWFDSN
jgi:hypothetical protein